MSGESDIAAVVSADTSAFTKALGDAQSTAGSFFSYVVDQGKAASVAVGSELANIAAAIYEETKSVLLEVGHELGAVALKTAVAGSAAAAAGSYFLGFWQTMRLGLSVASWFVPWLKVVTIGLAAVSVATYAYGKADEYLNGELSNSIFAFTETKATVSDVGAALGEAGAALGIAGDGIGSVSAQIAQSILYWTGVESAINAVDSAVAAVVSTGAQAVRDWALGVQVLSDSFSDMVSPAGASAAALRDMAAASEELIAKQEAMRPLFANLAAMQAGAAAQAEHNAEVQRIGSIATVDAINLEINALQQRAAAAILAGTADENSQKKTAELFAALENQRKKIESGGMKKQETKSAGQSAVESAENALRQLTLGQDEAAVAAAINAGATADEVAALRELQAEIAGVTAEQKAREESEKAAKDAANEQQRLYEQAESQIGNMVDQIDLMTGAATKADLAFRNALKDGFTREQANEIKALAEETARLEKEESRRQKFAQKTPLKAAMQGSQEAASILLRGVGGGKTMEQVAQKQLQTQQQMLIALRNNRPPQMPGTDLGVA